jgi:hypothetical protein
MRVLKERAAGESLAAAAIAIQKIVTTAIIIIDISISNPVISCFHPVLTILTHGKIKT